MKEKQKRNSAKSAKKEPVVAVVPPKDKLPVLELPSAVKIMRGLFGLSTVTFTLNAKASTGSAVIKVTQENEKVKASMIFQLPPVLREVFQLRAEAGHQGYACSIARCYEVSYGRFARAVEQMNYSAQEIMKEASHPRQSSLNFSPFWPFPMSNGSDNYCAGVEVEANDVSSLASTLHRFEADLPTIRVLFNALCDDTLKSMSKSAE